MNNWRTLNQTLNSLNEAQVKALLDEEIVGQRRTTFLKRLHQRYCILRAARERAEIFSAVAGSSDSQPLRAGPTTPSPSLDAPAASLG
jgi:hypothetical protein